MAKSSVLRGITVLEIAGLAPAPFAGMVLQDFGANVIRIDRPKASNPDTLHRGKRSISIQLNSPAGRDLLHAMADKADVLIDPFRPGVLERRGLGPDVLLASNPRLVIARMTGYGQTGPAAKEAGHDINYIAKSGVLSILGRAHENPAFPVNILGDFAAGGLMCALGIVMALFERTASGKGQVVDAAMIDGTAYLAAMLRNFHTTGFMTPNRGENMLDGAAHFYEVYKTKDGKFMSVGAIEPQFYAELLKGMGLADDASLPGQMDSTKWPEMKTLFTRVFASKTRDEWNAIFSGSDACVAPVLEMHEVETDPHCVARKLVIPTADGSAKEAAPAPRLSRTPALPEGVAPVGPTPGQHTVEILREFGVKDDDIRRLIADGVIEAAGGPSKL